MTGPLPKLETDEVIDVLDGYSRTGHYTELDLKRIERKMMELLGKRAGNPAHCHMILGIIGFLSHDRAKCEAGLRNAFLLAPGDSAVLMNGMVTLACVGNFDESIAAIHAGLERFPDNKQVLACATMQAQQTLQLSLAVTIMAQYDKLAINDKVDLVADLRKQLILANKSADAYGMTDAQTLDRLNTAVDSVRGYGYEVMRTSTLTLHDGTFIYNLYLPADSRACADANFQIAESLIEKFEDTGVDLFSIVCRPMSDFAEMRALYGAA